MTKIGSGLPSSAAVLLRQARETLTNEKRRGFGLNCLVQARKLEPDNAAIPQLEYEYFEHHSDRALALEREGNIQGALYHCEQALRILPENKTFLKMKERLAAAPKKKVPLEPRPQIEVVEPDIPARRRTQKRTRSSTGAASREKFRPEDRLQRILTGGENAFRAGNVEVALASATTVVKEDPRSLSACVLMVQAYRAKFGAEGKASSEALDRIFDLAAGRILVAETLKALAPEQMNRVDIRKHAADIYDFLFGTEEQRVFPSLAVALEAAGIKTEEEIEGENPTPAAAKKRNQRPAGRRPRRAALPPLPPAPRLSLEEQQLRDQAMAKAGAHFEGKNYAQAMEAYGALLKLFPNDIEIVCLFYLSALYRDYPFLVKSGEDSFDQMPLKLLEQRLVQKTRVILFLKENKKEDPAVCYLYSKYNRRAVFAGYRESRVAAGLEIDLEILAKLKTEIEEEFGQATVLSCEEAVQKFGLLKQAEDLFGQQKYEAAAKIFEKAVKLDPDDLKVACQFYGSSIYALLGTFPQTLHRSTQYKKGLRAIKMFERRIEGIVFLRNNPDSKASTLNKKNRRMFALLTQGRGSYGVFNKLSDARVAAGISRDPEKLQQLKREIGIEYEDLENSFRKVLQERENRWAREVAAAEEIFDQGRYARAAELFGQVAKLDPDNVRAFAAHHFCVLDRKFGFLTTLHPDVHMGLLYPAIFEYLSWEGTRAAIEAQIGITKRFLEPLYQQAQANKEGWFERAEALFEARKYQQAANLAEKLLRECDPHDVLARCYYYFNLMHLKYEFVGPTLRQEAVNEHRYLLVMQLAIRLDRRIGAITFFNRYPDLRHVSDVRALEGGKRVASSIGAGKRVRVFNGVREGKVAAGVVEDPVRLEEIIWQIDDEMRPLEKIRILV